MTVPLLTQLYMLQLEQYNVKRYIHWWIRHITRFTFEEVLPFRKTFKIWLLGLVSVALVMGMVVVGVMTGLAWLIIGAIIFFVFPIPLLLASLGIVASFEYVYGIVLKRSIRSVLNKHDDLIKIGITGSFGKTSTKDFLYEILHTEKYSLRTPKSFNTVYGINRMVQMELNSKHRYLIGEMGAFAPGEIEEMARLINPEWAILTCVGRQHLERFGSLENIVKAKFELVFAVDSDKALVNIDSKIVRNYLIENELWGKVKTFSMVNSQSDVFVSEYQLSRDGLEMTVECRGEKLRVKSSLFGTVSVQNLGQAIGLALLMGVSGRTITTAMARIKPSEHRLDLKKMGNAILIDNAYSSNEVGFEQLLVDIENLEGKKVIVTPGLVELGDKADAVHLRLGERIAQVCDACILVGESTRTKRIEEGILNGKRDILTRYIARGELDSELTKLSLEYDWILLENDLPENYN
jgi:UDP-N-acetylmuramoyl-tripeptide--D-alanyl-D-alanine ligase